MKNLIKISILAIGLSGISQINTNPLDSLARQCANQFFIDHLKRGGSFFEDSRKVLEVTSLGKAGTMVAGSISAFVAFLFACYTIKRVISKNTEENGIWRTCKTLTGFLSTLGFSSAVVTSAFFYKVCEYVHNDFSNLANYGITLARITALRLKVE